MGAAEVKRGEINEKLGCTDAQLRGQIRSALRKVWRNSARRVFVEKVRVPYQGTKRFKYCVKCVVCGLEMGQSEKRRMVLADGSLSKKQKLLYEVDHIEGNHEFKTMEHLGSYAHTLFYGPMQILCWQCHKVKTNGKDEE